MNKWGLFMVRSRLMREGSVGIFLLAGLIAFGGIVFFLKKDQLRGNNYHIKLLFENAGGLREGARVFFRGVAVGRVAAIQPTSNGVEVLTEINNKLPIPRDVTVTTTRSGLLGEVSVNIIPQTTLGDLGKKINPLAQECQEKQLILCNNEQISATASPDLIESFSRLADSFDDPTFFNNLNRAVENANKATEKFMVLSQEIIVVTNRVQREMDTISNTFSTINDTANTLSNTANDISHTANRISNTAENFSDTAKVASTQIEKLGREYTNTAVQINLLASNLNGIIADNKKDFIGAIASLSQTAAEISQLAQTTNNLLSQVDEKQVEKISNNLGTTSENLAQLSQDLKNIASELNNPTNLATLQQTLDSARVTFANTAKITSDIDQFTGDPQFRRNLKKLVDGLSNLVSYRDLLEKQVELAILLQELDKQTAQNTKDKWTISPQKLPISLNQKSD